MPSKTVYVKYQANKSAQNPALSHGADYKQRDAGRKIRKEKSFHDLELSSLPYSSLSMSTSCRMTSLDQKSTKHVRILDDAVDVLEAFTHLRPLASPTSEFGISYVVMWEVPSFLEAFFSSEVRLGDVMTITGSETEAYAVSCRTFLKNTWTGIADVLLQALEDFLLPASLDSVKGNCGMLPLFPTSMRTNLLSLTNRLQSHRRRPDIRIYHNFYHACPTPIIGKQI